jgi:signal transduction histidine kinase/CheY-like chemotaxis protein
MKYKLDHYLLLGIIFALLSIIFLFSLQRGLSTLNRINEANVILSQISSALYRQQDSARAIRSGSSTREMAEQNSLSTRDELGLLFQELDHNFQESDQESTVFVRQLQQDWNQLEGYMQDLRTGYEASLSKALAATEKIQKKIQEQSSSSRTDGKKAGKGLSRLFTAWILLTILICAGYLIARRLEKQGRKRALNTFLALSREFGKEPEQAETLTESQLANDMEKTFSTCFERFQKELQLKDNFFASMSHEIRTPLNGLVGFLSNLAETPLNDQQQQYLRIIDSSARSLMHVINQILDYSKIQAGRLALEEIPFDLHDFVEERVAVARQLAKNKPLRVHLEFNGSQPQIIRADAGRLRQVLDNLLNNAIKFTDRGEVVLEVNCRDESDNDVFLLLDFAVRDSGVGIPFNVQQRLFKPFAQADDTIARRYGGTGLGLSISSALVKLMGGQMNLRSRPGEGSCFSFTLRALSAKPEEQVRISELYRVILPRTELKKHWALLVDDTPTNLFLLETICQSVGLPYRTAENGREALDLCRQQRFDLIFMDIQMPIMDGYTAIREIRKLDNSGRTHIIALTASAFQEDIDRAFGAGSTGFIPKPFERDQLLLCIANALGVTPERKFREPQLQQETSEGAVVRRMHDFMREQYQISLGEIKMILAQTVADWRPVLDNLATYSQQGNAEETIAILQRLKGQLVSIGLLDQSEQTVTIIEAFRNNDRSAGQIMVTNFCQSLTRIFKVLEQEVTVNES